MRKIITSIVCLLLAAVLISLGGYFLTERNKAPAASDDYENFQFVVEENPVEVEEITYIYTDIVYTEEGFVQEPSEVITQICTGEDMLVIADHPDLKYTLMCDIDMNGIDWVPVPLTGSFDGQGHTIYNLSVSEVSSDGATTKRSGGRACADTRFAGLFSRLDNAEVTNLNLTGAYIKVESEQGCYAGTIAGYADNAVITNCVVESHMDLTVYGSNNGAGGILGYGSAIITDCTVDTEIIYSDMHSPDQSDNSIGGLMGDGYALITNCVVDADLYATANAYLYCGGVVGQYTAKDLKLEEETPNITGGSATGNIFYGCRSARARINCDEIYGYLAGFRPNKINKKNFTSKITTLTGVTENMIPECANPELVETLVKPTCHDLGCVIHTCKNCGYSYTDNYVIPSHVPGEPEYIEYPEPGVPGEAECYCEECEELLFTAVVETTEPPPHLSLSYVVMDVEYGSTAVLDASNARGPLTWTSDNPEVVSVDDTGRVTAMNLGSTAVTCTDGETTVKCKINVRYSSEQSFLRKYCFGWVWME